jgi:coronin-7
LNFLYFIANPLRVAVPLNTPGGKVAIFELSKPGRQPDGVIPALVHGSKVMDFMWDPFNNARLAVGCDGGKLWIWKIPEDGLKEQTNEPEFTIAAHGEKIYFVKFHNLTKDILATGSYDMSIRIWDLADQQGLYFIPCQDQVQIFSFAWSPCGAYFATSAKDGKIRVYDPRVCTDSPLREGNGPAGVRGGRVCWALDGRYLIVVGFDRSSERQVLLYDAGDMSRVASVSLDVSPAILVPFYDEDSSILFLSGRVSA